MSFANFFLPTLLGIILIHQTAYATTNVRQYNYYDTTDICKGWYCYKDPNLNTPESSNDTQKTSQDQPFNDKINWDALWTMPADSMKKLINDAMSWAQEDLSDKKRMLTYLKLQGVAMRRAKKFQELWDETLLENPLLDETVQRSPTRLASLLEVSKERQDRKQTITQMSSQMGLLYFYSPNCAYCQKEQDILSEFKTKWSWQNITAINIQEHPELTQKYDVQVVPDLWIVGNTANGIQQRRLKAGLASHGDIESSLMMAWNLWFNAKRYERPSMTQEVLRFNSFIHR